MISQSGEESSESLVDFFVESDSNGNVDVDGNIRKYGERIRQSDISGYAYIYKEDGVVKCDITQHMLLENVSVSAWDASDVLNMKIEAKSVNGNSTYYIVEDTVNGGYKAEEASKVEMERSEIVLQPLYRNV